jgi:anti-sigma factor RsiW
MFVTDRTVNIRRASDALTRGIEAAPDDFAHPDYETLEALVRGELSSADREVAESHIALCSICAEDLADLSMVQAEIATAIGAVASRSRRIQMVWAGGSLAAAAAIFLAVWLGRSADSRPSTPPQRSVASNAAAREPAQSDATKTTLRPDEQVIVTRAIEGRRLELPVDARTLAEKAGTLLGAPEADEGFAPVAPRGTAVLSPRPVFTWQPMRGATSYTVGVFDDRFNEVARGAGLTGTTWTPEADLARSTTYAWQITAHLPSGDVTVPSPPRPEARFRVLDAAAAAVALEQQSRLAGEPLALGILLARAGLVDNAARAFERAATQPGDRDLARALLSDLPH